MTTLCCSFQTCKHRSRNQRMPPSLTGSHRPALMVPLPAAALMVMFLVSGSRSVFTLAASVRDEDMMKPKGGKCVWPKDKSLGIDCGKSCEQ